MEEFGALKVGRVELGVRMEESMVKVLRGLADLSGITLGLLVEKIVLHSFSPVPGQEGEMAYSPHGKRALTALAELGRIHGMEWDGHSARKFAADERELTAGRLLS